MTRILAVTSLLILFTWNGFAQNMTGLSFTKFNTQNTKFITEGSNIKVKIGNKTFKGNFTVLSDQEILINTDTIQISHIQELRAKTATSIAGGLAILIPGALIGSLSVYAIAIAVVEAGGYAIIGIILFAPLATIGILAAVIGARILSNGKKFVPYKWKFSTITPSTSPVLN